jgi:hypothetical protein
MKIAERTLLNLLNVLVVYLVHNITTAAAPYRPIPQVDIAQRHFFDTVFSSKYLPEYSVFAKAEKVKR